MTFLIVPHQVSATSAEIWVGAADEKEDVRQVSVSIEHDDGGVRNVTELDSSAWLRWESYSPGDEDNYSAVDRLLHRLLPKFDRVARSLDYQRVKIEDLEPRTSYALRLHVENQEHPIGVDRHLREGRVTTLPKELPDEAEKPFTVLLGSCFYGRRDLHGMVGATYHYLPDDRRPDIKVLCGDQVYLDNPWYDTSFRYNGGNLKPGLFRAKLLEKYLNTWAQVNGEDAGFRQLLKDGANYFCSDDHEFWNNAPNFGGVGFINTLSRGQRCWWYKAARELFGAFQSPKPLMRFDVGRLSFCVADTRINRSIKRDRFMNIEDFNALKQWIEGLQGPGVLVIGQPVLTGGTGTGSSLGKELTRFAWSFLDRDLADYDQYKELVKCINDSDHSIVVLTGDVHFGRVASVKLNPASDDANFVEVISSPMRVVVAKIRLFEGAKNLAGHYRPAPTHPIAITESQPLAPEKDHFVTVEFCCRNDEKVQIEVRSWPILESGEELPPSPDQTFVATLR